MAYDVLLFISIYIHVISLCIHIYVYIASLIPPSVLQVKSVESINAIYFPRTSPATVRAPTRPFNRL